LIDTDGTPQATLGADVAGPMLTFYDKQGAARMRVGLEDGTEAPIVDVVDRASGSQSRVSLVALREARSTPLPPPSPIVRRTVVRGWRPQRSVVTEASVARPVPARNYAVCAPGTLGCSRYPGGREG
jgi:hypothetical protein